MFKPDNVMLGDDGRVRVMDFGLARASDERAISTGPAPQVRSDQVLESPLTQTGTVMGTPAYMPLEQFEGRPADARSDQFSFCVALYEALYGERPFVGENLAALMNAVDTGQVRAAPKGSAVPSWLRAAVLRGLRPEPALRWPSMSALLAALADDPSLRRRKWQTTALVTALVAGGAWGATEIVERDAQTCKGFGARLTRVWDEARRAELEAAFAASGVSYASETWGRVQPWLDDYAAAWVAAREDACESTRRGEQSAELLDLRMACLDERLAHLRVTVDVLATAEAIVIENAVEAAASLPRLDRCEDIAALTAALPPPESPQVAARVAAVDARLVEALALERTGRRSDGLVLADAAVADATTLDYEPLRARALLRQGQLQHRMGKHQEAEAGLRRALSIALGARMTAEAAAASSMLVFVVGYDLARYEEGWRWAELAEPLARAAGTDEARALYLNSAGNLAQGEGRYAEARRLHEQALALKQEALGPEHPDVASSINNLAIVARLEGDLEEARRLHERALAVRAKNLGSEHPDVAHSLTNLGVVARDVSDYAEARRYSERALAIQERALGPEHPDVAVSLNNLGVIAIMSGRRAEARGYWERALTIQERALGPEHPELASYLSNLGAAVEMDGDHAEARRLHERALAIREKTLGPRHPDVAQTLHNLGEVAKSEGKLDEARRHYEQALAIREEALGPDHARLALPLTGLGGALLGLGRPTEALAPLERALALLATVDLDPTQLAETRFALAQALWEAPAGHGRDRRRATELAGLARDAFAGAGPKSATELATVEAWLAGP